MYRNALSLAAPLAALCYLPTALAVQACELDGQHFRRERELDERGKVVRDDEVFEDGSRKAVGR